MILEVHQISYLILVEINRIGSKKRCMPMKMWKIGLKQCIDWFQKDKTVLKNSHQNSEINYFITEKLNSGEWRKWKWKATNKSLCSTARGLNLKSFTAKFLFLHSRLPHLSLNTNLILKFNGSMLAPEISLSFLFKKTQPNQPGYLSIWGYKYFDNSWLLIEELNAYVQN